MTAEQPTTPPAPSVMFSAPPGMRLVEDKPNPWGEMFRSKKFVAMLVGVLFSLLTQIGVKVTPEVQEQVVNLILVYMGAQGVADVGKSYAQVKTKVEQARAQASATAPRTVA